MEEQDHKKSHQITYQVIDEIVTRRLKEEREFVSKTIGVALKIGGGAIAIALTALTIAGFTNLGDLRKFLEKKSIETTEEYLNNEGFRDIQEKITRIYSKSLIDHNLQGVKPSHQVELKVSELRVLLDYLLDPSSDELYSYGAFSLLGKPSSIENWDSFIEEQISKAVIAKDEEFIFLRKNHQRWNKVIELAGRSEKIGLYNSLQSLLSQRIDSQRIINSAINALSSSSTGAGTKQILVKYTKHENEIVRNNAFLALARAYPENKHFIAWVEDLVESENFEDQFKIASYALYYLSQEKNRLIGKNEFLKKIDIGKKLLFAVKGSYQRFEITAVRTRTNNSGQWSDLRIDLSKDSGSSEIFKISKRFFEHIINRDLNEFISKGNFEGFKGYIDDFSNMKLKGSNVEFHFPITCYFGSGEESVFRISSNNNFDNNDGSWMVLPFRNSGDSIRLFLYDEKQGKKMEVLGLEETTEEISVEFLISEGEISVVKSDLN